MAKGNWWALFACLVVTILSNAQLAQSQNLFVDIGGTVRNNVTHPDGANTDRVVLANADGTPQSYGNITITRLQPGSPAMLERVTDGSLDIFALHNVKIKRVSGPVTNFPITFWGTAQQLPANPPNYYYNLDAAGSFTIAGTFHINSFTFRTSIKPSGGSWTQFQSWTRTSIPTTFITSRQSSSAFSNLGTNPRDLKGELVITLSANDDELAFDNGSGAKARSGGQADCDVIDNFFDWFREPTDTCAH